MWNAGIKMGKRLKDQKALRLWLKKKQAGVN